MTAARVIVEIAEKQDALAALDIAIRITNERLRPDAAGIVKRFNVNYGKRGALLQAIRNKLKSTQEGISHKALGKAMAAEFGIVFWTKLEEKQFVSNTIRRMVTNLARLGHAERLPAVDGKRRESCYRWKDQSPAFAGLLPQAGMPAKRLT